MPDNNAPDPFAQLIAAHGGEGTTTTPNGQQQPQTNNASGGVDPFSQLIKSNGGNIPSQTVATNPAQQQATNDQGAFMAGVDQFNRSFGKIVEGTLQIGANISSTLGGGKDMENYSKDITNYSNQQQQAADISAKQHPIASTIGDITGGAARVIPTMIATGGGSILAQLAKGALANAGVSALDIAPDTATRVKNIMDGGAIGMIGTAGGLAVGKALQGIGTAVQDIGGNFLSRILTPKTAVINDLAQEVKYAGGSDVVANNGKGVLDNFSLTPAEQIGTSSAKKAESGILFGNAATKESASASELARQQTLKNTFNDSVDTMGKNADGTPVTKDQVSAAFQDLSNYNVNIEQSKPLLANSTFNAYNKAVNKDPIMPEDLQSLSGDNVLKLNSVKKAMQDDMWNKTSGEAKPLNSDNLSALMEAKNKLYNTLNAATDGKYAEANKLSQQLKLKNNIIDDLKEIPGITNINQATPNQIYNKLFPNPQRVEVYLDMVKDTGGDVETASKLINTLQKLNTSPMPEVLSKQAGFHPTSVGDALHQAIGKLTQGRYNAAYAQLLYDNTWQPQVAQALAKGSFDEKIGNLAVLMSNIPKSVGIGIANQGKAMLPQIQAQQPTNNTTPIGKSTQQ